MYELLGVCLVLAGLLSINTFASMVSAGCWRLLSGFTTNWSAENRARLIFTLRVGPPALALAVVVALVIPSYLVHEPRSSGEIVSLKLATLALLSFAGLFMASWRGVKSLLATRTLLEQWLDGATSVEVAGTNIPAFCIEHPFPVIAVVGLFRPRLFIARRVLESLTADEMLAALAHETGHLEARDNLRRTLVRACKDVLTIIPCGVSLDRAWAENAEAAADEAAATRGSSVALDLASALIEIARMVPPGGRPTMPLAAFLLGDGTDGVKGRVRRLLDLAGESVQKRKPASRCSRWMARSALLSWVLLVTLLLVHFSALTEMHDVIEHAVRFLS